MIELELSDEGRVMIPVSILRRLGIKSGNVVDIHIRDGEIVISPKRQPEGTEEKKLRRNVM